MLGIAIIVMFTLRHRTDLHVVIYVGLRAFLILKSKKQPIPRLLGLFVLKKVRY